MLKAYARRQVHLTAEEEHTLIRRAADGDREAVDRLVSSHLPFVLKLARRYRRYDIDMSDLIQEGTIGLMQALARFNPDRNVRLATYAMWWIRAAMQDYVVRSWSLVRIGTTAAQRHLFFTLPRGGGEADAVAAYAAPYAVPAGPGGGDADPAESRLQATWAALAQRFEVQVAEVRALARRLAGRDLSLDVPARGDESGLATWLDRLPDERATPEDVLVEKRERRQWIGAIRRGLTALQPREVMILQARFLAEQATPRETIGRQLGISKYRVRQLEQRALTKLRGLLPVPDPGR